MRVEPKSCAMAVVFLTCSVILCCSATIHVDSTNTADPAQDGTLAHPWATTTGAVAQLTVENGLSQGGHTVLFHGGTYTDQINLTDASHSGLNGSPNIFLGTNNATIDTSGNYCFSLEHASYITIERLNLTGASTWALWSDSSVGNDHRIAECNIYSNNAGVFVGRFTSPVLFQNCNIVANSGDAIYGYQSSDIYIKNCNIIDNAGHGAYEYRESVVFYISYSILYANGLANFAPWVGPDFSAAVTYLYTADEINAWDNCSNNLVVTPGFYSLDDWDFSTLYENSPCLGNGEEGANIGAYTNPTLVALSNKTYYVSPAGDDSNTGNTPADAWKTVSKAALYAGAGDSVIIAPGTYTGMIEITRGGSYTSPVSYVATDSEIDGTSVDHGLYLHGAPEVTVSGFSIHSSTGAGVCAARSYGSTFRNMTLQYNTNGGFQANASGNCMLDNCRIKNNTGNGLTVDTSCYVFMTNCIVASNSAHGFYLAARGGIDLDSCDICCNGAYGISTSDNVDNRVVLRNTHVYENGNNAINARKKAHITMRNCDIYANNGDGVFLMAIGEGTRLFAENCNIVSNSGYGVHEYRTNAPTLSSCNFYSNTPANFMNYTGPGDNVGDDLMSPAELNGMQNSSNNIVGDPLYVAPPSDMRFRPSSPCVDAGTATSPMPLDYYNRQRLVHVAVDIGAYELPNTGTVLTCW